MFSFDNWIRQPTTIHALGATAAGVGAALSQVTTGNHTIDMVIAAVAYVAVHLGIDDHSAQAQAAQTLVSDLLHKADPAKVMADASAVAAGLTPPAPNDAAAKPVAA